MAEQLQVYYKGISLSQTHYTFAAGLHCEPHHKSLKANPLQDTRYSCSPIANLMQDRPPTMGQAAPLETPFPPATGHTAPVQLHNRPSTPLQTLSDYQPRCRPIAELHVAPRALFNNSAPLGGGVPHHPAPPPPLDPPPPSKIGPNFRPGLRHQLF